MTKLTPLQKETMDYCKKQIDDARKRDIDFSRVSKRDKHDVAKIIDAQNGIVYTQGGRCTIRTLRALEEKGLLKVLDDQTGVGTGYGAFPSKVEILNY